MHVQLVYANVDVDAGTVQLSFKLYNRLSFIIFFCLTDHTIWCLGFFLKMARKQNEFVCVCYCIRTVSRELYLLMDWTLCWIWSRRWLKGSWMAVWSWQHSSHRLCKYSLNFTTLIVLSALLCFFLNGNFIMTFPVICWSPVLLATNCYTLSGVTICS